MTTRRYALRDDQWERIKDLLPGREGTVGVTASYNRLFVEAVLYRYRAGIPWRDLPGRFGDFRVVHMRFSRWSKTGVWERVFQHLASDADNEYAMIDATIVRAHQHSAGALVGEPEAKAIGRSKGGVSTKIHAVVDALSQSLKLSPYPRANQRDLDGADQLLPNVVADTVLGDKGYDADARVIEPLQAQGKTAVIPPRRNRKHLREYDKQLYKARHGNRELLCQAEAVSSDCNALR
jgi:transposase